MGYPDASLSVYGAFDDDGRRPDAWHDEDVLVSSLGSDALRIATSRDGPPPNTSRRSRSDPGHTASRSAPAGGTTHTRKAGNPLAPPLGAAEGMDETTISGHTRLGCGFGRFCYQGAQGVVTITSRPGPSSSSTALPDSIGLRLRPAALRRDDAVSFSTVPSWRCRHNRHPYAVLDRHRHPLAGRNQDRGKPLVCGDL